MFQVERLLRGCSKRAVLAAALVSAAAGCGGVPGDDAGATETVHSTSQALTSIASLAALRAMSPTGNYVLTADIDASDTQLPGREFIPIGDQWNNFSGTLDGQNHTINNLRIVWSGPATGLFAYATNATIKRVGLTNVSVRGLHQTGALVGVTAGTSITSCYVTGTVSGYSGGPWYSIGMMVGVAYGDTNLWKVYATGTLSGPVLHGGGLVGDAFGYQESNGALHYVTIHEAFTDVNVNPSFVSGGGTTVSGGLVGATQGVDIQNVHTKGTVSGDYSGGILGEDVGGLANVPNTNVRGALTRAVVKVRGVAEPGYAGPIGHDNGYLGWCEAHWDSSVDAGSLRPGTGCGGGGFSTNALKNAHPSPNRVYYPYIYGMLLPNGDGSDGHWDTAVWNFNSSSQLTTLRNIPNPSVQSLY